MLMYLADVEKLEEEQKSGITKLIRKILQIGAIEQTDSLKSSFKGKALLEVMESILTEEEKMILEYRFAINRKHENREKVSELLNITVYEEGEKIATAINKLSLYLALYYIPEMERLEKCKDIMRIMGFIQIEDTTLQMWTRKRLESAGIKTLQHFSNLTKQEQRRISGITRNYSLEEVRKECYLFGLPRYKDIEEEEKEHQIRREEFSTRAYRGLKHHGIDTLEQFSRLSKVEQESIPEIGKKSLMEIREKCKQYGLVQCSLYLQE